MTTITVSNEVVREAAKDFSDDLKTEADKINEDIKNNINPEKISWIKRFFIWSMLEEDKAFHEHLLKNLALENILRLRARAIEIRELALLNESGTMQISLDDAKFLGLV